MSTPREALRESIRTLKAQFIALGVGAAQTAKLVGEIVRETVTEITRGGARRPGRPPKAAASAPRPVAKPKRGPRKGAKRSVETRAKMMAGHAGKSWDELPAAEQRAYLERVKAKDRGEDVGAAPKAAKPRKAKRGRPRGRRAKMAAVPTTDAGTP